MTQKMLSSFFQWRACDPIGPNGCVTVGHSFGRSVGQFFGQLVYWSVGMLASWYVGQSGHVLLIQGFRVF